MWDDEELARRGEWLERIGEDAGPQSRQLPAKITRVTPYPDGTTMTTTIELVNLGLNIAAGRYMVTAETADQIVRAGPMTLDAANALELRLALGVGDGHE